MNSKERVLAAAERKRTDRPPTSLYGTPEAMERLRKYMGVATDADVMDELDIDLRWVGAPFIGPQERSTGTLEGEGTDFWGCRYRKAENEFNTYFEFDYHPLAEALTVDDVENHDWPSAAWWDYSKLPASIAAQNRVEPRAIIYFAGGAFESPWYIRGMENFLMDLYENPEIVEAICTHVVDFYTERTRRALAAAQGGIDIINSGGDIGSQHTMLLDPDLWRKHIKPFSSRLIAPYKEMGLKTFYHSCGAIVPVIDDLIEMGLDILDPIQPKAAGMDPENIFAKFGDRLSFHGAIDEQELLPHATADEVYAATTHVIDTLGKNGGYIVAPAHAVQGDTPPENVVAIYKAVQDYRWR